MIWIGGFGWGPGIVGLVITVVMFAVNALGLYLVVRHLLRRTRDDGDGRQEGYRWQDDDRQHYERQHYDAEGSYRRDIYQQRDVHGARPRRPAPPRDSSALRILEERYARGEIDHDEFLRRREDLIG